MPNPSEWDRLVNSKWPRDLAKPSAQEAITGAKRLYRRAMGRPFRGKVVATSGRRYSWIRRGVMVVNPSHGWPEIVHLLSHYFHRRLHPKDRPHSYKALDLESDLARYAIAQGFHLGKLKSKPRPTKPKPTRQEAGHAAAVAALKRWEAKRKRAETAIRKYRKKVRYYEKAKTVIRYASGLQPSVEGQA